MKTPIPDPYCRAKEEDHRRNMRVEARVYARIGEHPRVPRALHWDERTRCLEMEFLGNGDLKGYIQSHHHQGDIASQLRLRWCRQAAEALPVLHGVEVMHCDISPRDFLLDAGLT